MSNAVNDTDAVSGQGTAEGLVGRDQDLLSLTQAAKLLPRIDGKKVSVCTLWRWCRVGLRGVYLEYVRVGRKICVSQAMLTRFFFELSALDRKAPPAGPPRTPAHRKPLTSRQRLRALGEADKVLARAGI